MHEFVLEGVWDDVPDIHALDVAKRLMDYGLHPPTNYFPLIVKEALMIEPTETESKQTLDYFVDAMKKIAKEAHEQPELLHDAPHNAAHRPPGRSQGSQRSCAVLLATGRRLISLSKKMF